MNSYNIVVKTEAEKYDVIQDIQSVGAVLTGVSGYYDGYYIQLDATPEQVFILNQKLGGVLHDSSINYTIPAASGDL